MVRCQEVILLIPVLSSFKLRRIEGPSSICQQASMWYYLNKSSKSFTIAAETPQTVYRRSEIVHNHTDHNGAASLKLSELFTCISQNKTALSVRRKWCLRSHHVRGNCAVSFFSFPPTVVQILIAFPWELLKQPYDADFASLFNLGITATLQLRQHKQKKWMIIVL